MFIGQTTTSQSPRLVHFKEWIVLVTFPFAVGILKITPVTSLPLYSHLSDQSHSSPFHPICYFPQTHTHTTTKIILVGSPFLPLPFPPRIQARYSQGEPRQGRNTA
ncbi:hypothetical protein ONS96_007287 [Cadophora gregata f. sp. sojae]|nr:hypothetical protein ONS96_007287 [Cadophora gregata f. sp. sojae]